MTDITSDFERASMAVAHDGDNAFDAVVPPIVQTSLFTFSTFEEMAATYRGEKSPHGLFPYQQSDHPGF